MKKIKTKIWKEKIFPTRRGAINFSRNKAVAELPTRVTKVVEYKKRLIQREFFKVRYLGRD